MATGTAVEPPSTSYDTRVHITILSAHNHDPACSTALISRNMHPEVRAEALRQLGYGQSVAAPLLRHIREYGKEVMLKQGLPINMRDSRFFPSVATLRRLRGRTLRDSRMSHVDQDAVRRRTEKYARQDPNGHYHFQASGTNSKFMVVYQTAEQRRMLRLYGRDIIMLDATYKTQQWGLPLFNILVRDNHRKGYPVATFVLEDEKGMAGARRHPRRVARSAASAQATGAGPPRIPGTAHQ